MLIQSLLGLSTLFLFTFLPYFLMSDSRARFALQRAAFHATRAERVALDPRLAGQRAIDQGFGSTRLIFDPMTEHWTLDARGKDRIFREQLDRFGLGTKRPGVRVSR